MRGSIRLESGKVSLANGNRRRKSTDPSLARDGKEKSSCTATGRILFLALLCGFAASPVPAEDLWWDPNFSSIGLGGNGAWNTTDQLWSPITPGQPTADGVSGPWFPWNNAALDNAFFAGTAGTVTLASPITVHDITFQSGGYTLTGGTLTLAGTDPSFTTTAGTTSIDSVVNITTGGLIKNGGGTLTLTADNSFNGGIDLNGGALSLQGANTFTGAININSGTLVVSGDSALGDSANEIIISSGGLTGGTTGGDLSNRTVNLTGGQVTIRGTGVYETFFTGIGGVSAQHLWNDSNNYEGKTSFVGSGSFTSIADLGTASSLGAPVTVADGTIHFQSPNQHNATLSYLGDGDTSDRNWTINPGSGPGGIRPNLVNAGTGTLTLNGDIALGGGSGNTAQFTAGSADLELTGVISSNNGRPVTFAANAGQTVRVSGDSTFAGAAVIGGAGTVEASSIANTGIASSLGAGSGVSISGHLSYTGAAASSDRNWSLSNGTLANDGTGALDLGGDMTIAGISTLGGSFTGADNTFSGTISGTGSLRSDGDATWVLSGTNTYTGDTIVDNGELRAGNAGAFAGSDSYVVNGGTLNLNSFDQTIETLDGSGGEVALGSATLTLEGDQSVSSTYAGSITGSGGLTKQGGSELTLTGASTYTGDTVLLGGTLNLDFSDPGSTTSTNIIGSGSTLNMAGGVLNVLGADGANNTQTFDGLNITAGNNTIEAVSGVGGSMTVNLGTITRSGGLANFNLPENGNITTTNASLGGWATVNGSDYAKVEGGNILAFEESDYTDKDNAANWLDGEFITDVDGFFGTVSGSKQLGGLRYTQPVSTTVEIGTGETLGVDGAILVSPSVENFNQLITGGSITGGADGDLGIRQNSEGNFTIDSQIVDHTPGTPTGFVKAGTGLVTLGNGDNSYTGATTIAQGVLSVDTIANGGVNSGIGASAADSSNLWLEGGTLRYTGGTASSDRGFTFVKSGDILGAGIEVTEAGTNFTFSGLVTSPDDATLTKSGAGTLTLANGANDYVGGTIVTGGLLSVDTLADGGLVSGIGMSSSDAANLVLDGGGLQYTGGTIEIDRGLTLGAEGNDTSGTIEVTDSGTTLTFAGTIDEGTVGQLIKEGDGTLVLSGTTNYRGGNIVNAGVLRAGGDNTLGAPTSVRATNVAAGATLDLNNFDNWIGPLNGEGDVTLGTGTLQIHRGNGNFSGAISGDGGVLRTGGGTQTFNGANNTYTGVTRLEGGNLSVDTLANGGVASGIGQSDAASANLVLINAALIYTGGDVTTDRGFTVAGTGIVNVADANTTLEFTGDAIGTGGLRKDGPGTLLMSGTNTYTSNTHVTGGILRAGSNQAFGNRGMFLNNTAGVLLDLNGFDNSVGFLNGGGANGGNIELDTATLTLDFAAGGAAAYAGAISGSGGLVVDGHPNFIQRLTGSDSSYTGPTVINSGTLEVVSLADGGMNSSIGASTAAAGNLILDGGTLDYIGDGDSTNREFTLGTNDSTLASSGAGTIEYSHTGPVTLTGTDTPRTLTLDGTNTGDNRFSLRLDDNGTGMTSLTKDGPGTWRLTNPGSTYTGVTTISGGVLSVDKMSDGGQASSIGASTNDASNLVIGNDSTFRYTGSGDTTDRRFSLDTGITFIESSGTGALVFTDTGQVELLGTDAPRTIALGGTNSGNNILAGSIGDNGTGLTTLAKNDSGNWVLTGDHTYTGNTVINDGNLTVGFTGLGYDGTSGNVGAGNVIVASATSTLSLNRSDTFAMDGLLSGIGTLAQTGGGTSILTHADNQIAMTTVGNGTLQIDGGLVTSSLTMTGNGTLEVNGLMENQSGTAQPVFLQGDGGNSTLTVNNGGLLRANGDLGAGNDTIQLSGTFDTGGGVALGDGNDRLVLNDGATLQGAGVSGGDGNNDEVRANNALDLVFDGSLVGGFERLVKDNVGRLTLLADHVYSAGTRILDGILEVGDGGTSGALFSDVENESVLAFHRSDEYVFAGEITGTGEVQQIGSGTTILTGDSSYTGLTAIADGTLQIGDGGDTGTIVSDVLNDGALVFNRSDEYNFGGAISGTGRVEQIGGGILTLSGNNSYSGTTNVAEGILRAGSSQAFSSDSAFTVRKPAELDLAGRSQTVGGLANFGTVRFTTRPRTPGTTLTVRGDYEGQDGLLVFNTVLGDDNSATDRAVFQGGTSGRTDILVNNIGGTGDQTEEGIKLIQVGDDSAGRSAASRGGASKIAPATKAAPAAKAHGRSDGTFHLLGDFVFQGEQAVVAGAYAYRLHQGGVSTPGDGDWYLRSALIDDEGGTAPSTPHFQPGVPLYEAYASSLQVFNQLGTLQQRVGNRSWGASRGVTGDGSGDHYGIWTRTEGTYASFEPRVSTSGTETSITTWRQQVGVDGQIHDTGTDRLVAGVFSQFGTVPARITSPSGRGLIDATGYGVGASLTWYNDTGFYLDGVAQRLWYESDLLSATAGRRLAEENEGDGYGLSLEAGQRIALNEKWALTPQAQLSYSSVWFDDFTDPFGADVSLDESRSLVGRLGLALDRQRSWENASGRTNRMHLYGIANLYHEFEGTTRTMVGGTPLIHENDPWYGGVGLGWSLNWADDEYSFYGEVLTSTSLENFGDSNFVNGTLGFRMRW